MTKLYIAPGNAGTAAVGTNVELSPLNFASIKHFVLTNNINLVVVGPEEPLVKGIYDYFQGDGDIHLVPVIGPSMAGARLEGSKDFAKAFMMRHGIPTAAYRSFTKDSLGEAFEYIDSLRAPYVLKADGLAAGKGVVISPDAAAAKEELRQMIGGRFGAAGNTVVVEEFLSGIECSVFVATDGTNYKLLPEAKDYKRIGDGDTGPNTGGMGAVSPVPFVDAEFMEKVRMRIVEPTIAGLRDEKIDYKGFIFVGLMNVGGDPYVIEYNVRMGDPETEAVLARVESDVIGLFEGIVHSSLDEYELKVTEDTAATVVCVSGGYPGDYEKGKEISGLDTVPGSIVFHAGTSLKEGRVVTSGGRVLAVTSLGGTLQEALDRSYATVAGLSYEGMAFRSDIGKDLL